MLKINEKYHLAYITDEVPEGVGIAFSTKHGGVSKGYCESMNMSFNRDDEISNVEENYRRLSEILGIEENKLYICHQIHGDNIRMVSKNDERSGYCDDMEYDAEITNCQGVTLIATHADCIPVLLYDQENKCIGAVHSGWKGTLLEIAVKAAKAMKDNYGTDLSKLKVWIGPGICKDCFIVREDVYSQFIGENDWFKDYCSQVDEEYYTIDMKAIIYEGLKRYGAKPENIKDMNLCTSCNEGLFYSHRRDNGKTGTMAAFIWLTQNPTNANINYSVES